MLGTRRWLSIVLVTSMAMSGFGLAAGADSATESEFLAHINTSRSEHGLAPLSVDDGLRSHARKHTQDMMDADEIFHSTSEELIAAAGDGWSQLGENVGRGGSVSSLHDAFMDSPGHRANILGDYNYVGIGTGTKDGVLYVTVVFMQKDSTDSTTTTTEATTESTTTTTAKVESTTTTTAPTTTTTTLIVGPDKPVTPGESCLEATRFGWMCHD